MDFFKDASNTIHTYGDIGIGYPRLDGVLYAFAVIGFMLSFILLFFGKRLLRLSLWIIGFICFGSIPYLIFMVRYHPYVPLTTILITVLFVGSIAAFIVSYFTKFGVYIIGAASGVQLGFLLYEVIYSNRYEQSIILLTILTILFGLICLILPIYFMSSMVIGITAFNGFLFFRRSIQYILMAGITSRFMYSDTIYISGTYWGVLFGSLFVGFLGMFWQNYKYKNYPYLKNMEFEQTTNENV